MRWSIFLVSVAVIATQVYLFLVSPVAPTSCLFFVWCPNQRPLLAEESFSAFPGVKEVFEEQLRGGEAYGAQFAVFQNGKKVVSLFGGATSDVDSSPIAENTLMALFSSGKAVEPLLVAKLHHLGLLNLSAPISSIWSEFEAQDVTLMELLRHDAGLAWLERPLPLLSTHNLTKVRDLLAKTKRSLPKGRRLYHGVLRGVFLGELIKQATPGFMTRQAYRKFLFSEEQDQNFFLGGDPESARSRVCPIVAFSLVKTLGSLLFNVPHMDNVSRNVFSQLFDSSSLVARAVSNAVDMGALAPFSWTSWSRLNTPDFHDADLSSASAYGSAAGMASIMSIAATGGAGHWDDKTQSLLLDFSDAEARKFDHVLGVETTFTKGGLAAYTAEQRVLDCKAIGAKETCFIDRLGNLTAFGWEGTGGTLTWIFPELKLSLAYVSNTFHSLEVWLRFHFCLGMLKFSLS